MAPPRDAPCIPGCRLPSRSHDSVELQPDEEVTAWLNRVCMTMDARLHRVERRVAKLSRVHLGAALAQTLVWAMLTFYALSRGQPPPQVPGIPLAQAAPENTP